MASRPIVSAIVVSYRTPDLTVSALRSLVDFLPSPSELWVVDNASGDGSMNQVRERCPEAKIIELTENVGFGRANNIALGRSDGEYLLLLNSDARLTDRRTIPHMIERMREDPSLAVLGPKLTDADGNHEFSARAFPTLTRECVRRFGFYLLAPRATVGRLLLGDFWTPTSPTLVDWVTGACMLVRRSAYEEIGGFDPRLFMYGEEQEWARRFHRAGWRVLYDPEVSVVHRRAASGPPGPWRLRSSLEADVRVFRWAHGPLRAFLFNLVRLAGFLAEGAAFGIRQRIRPSEYSCERGALALASLRQQASIVLRRPIG